MSRSQYGFSEYGFSSVLFQDMVTYFLNLTHANLWGPKWEKEYSLTEAFQIPDGSVNSMHLLLGKLERDNNQLQRYYRYNSVQYDLEECDSSCQIDHICAIREVDFAKYNQCIKARNGAPAPLAPVQSLLFVGPIMGLIVPGLWGDLNSLGH